jgi:hypothetical protein
MTCVLVLAALSLSFTAVGCGGPTGPEVGSVEMEEQVRREDEAVAAEESNL